MKLFTRKLRHNFPLEIRELWLAGVQCIDDGIDHDTKRKVLMPYFVDHTYVKYDKGQVVPLFEDESDVAYYKIINWKRYPGSDPATFDDKREYDLIFDHLEAKSEAAT